MISGSIRVERCPRLHLPRGFKQRYQYTTLLLQRYYYTTLQQFDLYSTLQLLLQKLFFSCIRGSPCQMPSTHPPAPVEGQLYNCEIFTSSHILTLRSLSLFGVWQWKLLHSRFNVESIFLLISEFSTVTEVKRGSTFALRRSTLDFCLGGQRS